MLCYVIICYGMLIVLCDVMSVRFICPHSKALDLSGEEGANEAESSGFPAD